MTRFALDFPYASAQAPGASHPMAPARDALAFMAIIAVPTLLAYGFDERMLHGISVWSKPLKFEAALFVHFATLLLLAPLLSAKAIGSKLLRISVLAAAVLAILEIAYITLQAARGRHSHFNTETIAENVAYGLMGLGATAIVIGSFIFGVLIWRSRPVHDDGNAGLRTGAVLGLLAGSLGTVVVGWYLSQQGSHWIGGDPTDASGLPVTGWSTTGGDLRPAHFLSTHMMQVMPAIGLAMDRLRAPVATVWIVAALYVAVIAAVAWQALMGLPLIGR